MAFDIGTEAADPIRRFRPADDADIPGAAGVRAGGDRRRVRARQRLRAAGREVHFGLDALTRRVVVQVRSLGGEVLRTLPPLAALDFITSGAN